MSTTETTRSRDVKYYHGDADWPGIVSRFQLVILAGLRSKQLVRGAQARIVADPLRRRNTSIALEELKRGLVPFGGLNEVPAPTTVALSEAK